MKTFRFIASMILCAVMLMGCIPFTASAEGVPFADVPQTAWFYKAVEWAYGKGYIAGKSSTSFAPNDSITRCEFVGILAKIDGFNAADHKGTNFTDVKESDWFAPAVEWARKNGIVSGVGGGMFAPNKQITRQELCTMIVKYCEAYRGVTIPVYVSEKQFADADLIDDWAKANITIMQQNGMITGMTETEFSPKSQATRAQAATIFMRMQEAIDDIVLPRDQIISLYLNGSSVNIKSSFRDSEKAEDLRSVDVLIFERGSVRSVDTVKYGDTDERFSLDAIDDKYSNMYYIKDQLSVYKQNVPHGKAVLMLADNFSSIFLVPEVEQFDAEAEKFVNYLVPVIDALGFDGIDIDWEWPNNKDQLKMHTCLLKAFRNKFDELENETGKHYLLSISCCSGNWGFEKNELHQSQVYLDYINIMSYDIAAGGQTTMHHTAPCATRMPNGIAYNNLEDNLAFFLANRVPGSKILGGVGFDSRCWDSELLKGLTGDLPGLCVPAGSAGRYTAMSLYQIEGMIDKGGWKKYVDPDAKAPYLYNADTGSFITYEDKDSSLVKCDLSKKYNTAGLMIFTYHKVCDTPGVIAAMRAELDS